MTPTPRTTPAHPSRLLAVLLMAPFMAQADATIANVATPSIRADLGTSGAQLELVIGGYLIAFAMLLITGARLGQTHGYRRAFLLGVGVFTGASLLCGLAPGPIALIVARVLQGVGARADVPPDADRHPAELLAAPSVRGRIGLYAIALCRAAPWPARSWAGVLVSADLLGSDWRSIFFVNVAGRLAAVIVAGARYLPREDGGRGAPGRPRGRDRAVRRGPARRPAARPRSLGGLAGVDVGQPGRERARVRRLRRRRAARAGARRRAAREPRRDRPACRLVGHARRGGRHEHRTTGCSSRSRSTSSRGSDAARSSPGCTLVSWVAAFGAAGQIVRRLPPRFAGRSPRPPAACSRRRLHGAEREPVRRPARRGTARRAARSGWAGTGHAVQRADRPPDQRVSEGHAHDISGVTTTTTTIAGAIGIAASGTVYLSLASDGAATHAFAVVTAAFAAIAVLAALLAHGAVVTRPRGRRRARGGRGGAARA